MSVQAGSGYYGGPPQVDFGWLSQGWDLFKRDWVTWVLASLIVVGIVGVGFGMLEVLLIRTSAAAQTPAMSTSLDFAKLFLPHSFLEVAGGLVTYGLITLLGAGMYRMALRQIQGLPIGVGDLFSIGDVIVPMLGYIVISWVLSYVASLMFCIPGLIVDGLLLFAPLYIVAEKASAVEAITRSFNTLKGQWLMATLFYFVSSMLVGVSVLGCCVGVLATIPVFYLAVASGYLQFSGGTFTPGAPNYGPNVPGTWPPPPGAGQPFGQTPPPPYGTPPAGPSFGQSPQTGGAPQPPQTPWQPPQQGQGQPPPQSGGPWLGGGNNPDAGTPGQ